MLCTSALSSMQYICFCRALWASWSDSSQAVTYFLKPSFPKLYFSKNVISKSAFSKSVFSKIIFPRRSKKVISSSLREHPQGAILETIPGRSCLGPNFFDLKFGISQAFARLFVFEIHLLSFIILCFKKKYVLCDSIYLCMVSF